jgi:hypothetical protein
VLAWPDGARRTSFADPESGVDLARTLQSLHAAVAEDAPADRTVIERLLTDGAALVLALERELLRVKRRGLAALLDAAFDPAAAAEADHLALDQERLRARIAFVRGDLSALRTRATV